MPITVLVVVLEVAGVVLGAIVLISTSKAVMAAHITMQVAQHLVDQATQPVVAGVAGVAMEHRAAPAILMTVHQAPIAALAGPEVRPYA